MNRNAQGTCEKGAHMGRNMHGAGAYAGRGGMRQVARMAAAVLLSACLVVAYLPASAFAVQLAPASEDVAGTVTTSDGWTLSYEATADDDGAYEATVTGVESYSGTDGALSVPASITLEDGSSAAVTELANSAFKGCTTLVSIVVPEGVETIGNALFNGCTALQSATLPSTISCVPPNCFFNCTSLVEVDFAEGMTMEYLGYQAFRGCSSLEEIAIPALDGGSSTNRYVVSASTADEPRLGGKAFYGCTSMQVIRFLPGGDGEYYFHITEQGNNSINPFEGVGNDDYIIINYNRGSYATNIDNYYVAVNFYADRDVAEADPGGSYFDYQLVYPVGTNIYDIVYGDLASEAYEANGTMPELAEGTIWAVGESALTSLTSTLSDGVIVFPIDDEYDLTGGWVSCAQMEDTSGKANATTVPLDEDGVADLSGMTVYRADGSVVDESYYELTYLLRVVSDSWGHKTYYAYSVVYAGEVWEEGDYMVYATGVGECTGTTGIPTEEEDNPVGLNGNLFYVGYYSYSMTVSSISWGNTRSGTLGTAGLTVNESITGTPAFTVVACADSWQNCLIAIGLAAVGGGQAVFVEGVDEAGEDLTADRVYSVVSGSGTGKVYVVGEISDAATERLETVMEAKNGSISAFPYDDADDAAALSLSVYENLQRVADANGYAWGTTAVVASSTQQLASSAIAAYAYAGACPVILCEEDGTLSEEALADLAGVDDDGNALFERVVVAGPEGYVPAETVEAIEALGLEVERVADVASAYEGSVQVAEAIDADFGQDGQAVLSEGDYVVVSTEDYATLAVAAQLAAVTGARLAVVAASADVKSLAATLGEDFDVADRTAIIVGELETVDAALAAAGSGTTSEVLAAAWASSAPYSTALAAGDTLEHAGVLYEVTGAASVSFAGYAESALEVLEWGAFEHDGTTYDPGQLTASVTAGNTSLRRVSAELASIPAGLFAGCTALEEVGIAATSIGASAFAGCTSLASFSTAATSIGASAFSGCTALASVGLTAAGLKSIPASCFEGCSKLTSVSIASTALTSVGSKAFYGCKKLKSIGLTSGKLASIGASAFAGCTSLASFSTAATSIGASAFSGCTALASAKLTATGLKSIPASCFAGCAKLTSVSIASTALTSVGAKAFSGCKALKSISLKSAKLTSIGTSAFKGCSAMTQATVSSKKLKTIGASAFQGCTKLASVTIASAALKKVGAKAFYGCKKLKTLTLKSKKLKTIGASAFQGCSVMTKLTVSSTALIKVGAKALYGCKKLKTFTLKSKKLKSVGKNALKGTTKKLTVKVPKGKVKKYKKLLQKKGLKKKATVKAA